MALDPRYIPLYNLQQYIVDKTTLAAMSNGTLEFFSDINRTIPKTVYELSSVTGSYSYIALPNPVNLSAAGTPVDDSGADIVIYVFPYDLLGRVELYYVVAKNALGSVQWTREAVPYLQVNGSTPVSDAGVFNYIPNGQFLSHTTPLDNLLVAGSNYIAQGGWSIELNSPINSDNTLTFEVQGFTEDPPQSPRYIAVLTVNSTSALDTYKSIRIKWNDVNKFSANNDFYTFCFWALSNITIPVSIDIVRFFGTTGTIVPADVIATDNITTEGRLYQYQFQFPSNEGLVVDTVSNNDFVAIDIVLPTNIAFTLEFTDFVLADGRLLFTGFPLQTNADMITRSVFGWADVPDGTGLDLYLPPILTEQGMTWDTSQIGLVEGTYGDIISPLSTIPIPKGNMMPADGSIYPYHGRATNGIPFSRLGDYLIASNPFIPGVPLSGTGINYATAYTYSAQPDTFRLAVNSDGFVPAASDGNTLWTFYSLNGFIDPGIGYTSYSTGGINSATLLCVQDTGAFSLAPASDGTFVIGFSYSNFNSNPPPNTGLLAQQQKAYFTVTTVSAAALTQGIGNDAANWVFSNAVNTLQIYYVINGEVPPPVLGTQIPVILKPSYTAQEVADITREVINAYQISDITITSPAVGGLYWLFSTNPPSVINYYVWYKVGGVGVDPAIPGRVGIEVDLTSAEAADVNQVASITQQTINKQQYAAPDLRGMFPRGYDPFATWDVDAALRWSNISGLSGGHLGTFEFQNFLQHIHGPDLPDPPDSELFMVINQTSAVGYATTPAAAGVDPRFTTSNTGPAGGAETRPINFYINWFIRY